MMYTHGKVKFPVLFLGFLIILIVIFIVASNVYNSGLNASSTATSTVTDVSTSTSTVSTTSPSSVTTNPISGTPPQPPTLIPKFPIDVGHAVGIAAGGGLSKVTSTTLNNDLDEMKALGVTWVRFDIEWGNVQYSSPDKSTWSAYDAVVNAVAARHMNALVTILFTPGWARTSTCTGGAKCPPADPTQYALFAAEIAARYKGKVQAYEIWNEPNNYDFWATQTDCNAYTALLKVTYPAIKAADPAAIVVTGGLAPEATDKHNVSQMDFLSCIYKDGGEPYFDAVGDHPYTFPASPASNNTNTWAQMSVTVPSLRSIMALNGDSSKKIWMTEFGAPTNGPDPKWYISEQQQAQIVTDTMGLYKTYTWAGPIFWYTLQDGGTSTDTIENFFGLIRYDGTLKPAYTTLQHILSGAI